ncbi:GerAB/ArcD/ProY family transporter [Litchfieldia alkalitelluris]|uniref:GerAB/ArcD/ProY family transporter n=1 Tax=Litchfieldia alkalitelluris TaxID=304268 RepID=UPI000997FE38|nr:GerAB/ArcD/ProY family transporter [Litchfieldia alkalitelluris]
MVKERFLISPHLVFFVISSSQIGIGVLGFQRIIAKEAGKDSWMAILLAALCVHIIVFIMYRMLKESKGDLISIHQLTFGKWMGNGLSLFFIVYLVLKSIAILRSYVEVIQVWMFPELNLWVFNLYFLLLVIYIVTGGFRVVAGICLFSIILPFYLIFSIMFPIEFSSFRNLVPPFTHSVVDILKATKSMSLTVIGFEILLLIYPYIKNPEKSKKWAHLGVMYSTFIFLLTGVVSLIFFSEGQLEKMIWATLSMWKIVEIPIVERFEYVGITSWLILVIPNVCLELWASSRIIKRVSSFKQRHALIVLAGLVLICSSLLTTRTQINMVNDIVAQIGFYFVFFYIPFLYVLFLVVQKVRKKQ